MKIEALAETGPRVASDTREASAVPAERTGGSAVQGSDGARSGVRAWTGKVRRASHIEQVGAVYLLVAIGVIFSVWKPAVFPRLTTVQSILNSNATVALLALSLVIPLAAGVFDLSVGTVMALTGVLAAELVVGHGLPVSVALFAGLLVGLAAGAFNAAIVVGIGIESFIGTLGTSSVMGAIILLISNNESIRNEHLSSTLQDLATRNVGGIQLPVFIVVAVAVVMWYFLEHTVSGRRLYAIGFNVEAARLSGIHTKKLRAGALLTSGFLAGLAGLILMAQTGSGAPTSGPPYLLDAFAAVFLGATQFRNGRFNTSGTLLAVVVLGTGTTGLTIAGARTWTLNLFIGVVLVVALALTKLEVRRTAAPIVQGDAIGDEPLQH